MPRLDGTGPQGKGSRTGRDMGNCSGTGGSGKGLELGRGRGFGRFCLGCSFWNKQSVTKEDRKQILEEEKKLIEEELKKLD